ncbi:MAG: cyclic nucleotide-binding domain-containing protein [Candidatus Abyssobacteria bacterium SURF_17]|uniref:Cyclic nucleotide-binding domain-containing protein n=1 Tax=Candidatus Abyssobacteria bacterium SURF_17 TaxID=2093361 RepID=A0A419EX93_9BACT|nr:MAG: cyclic nucleotide-binding domain-containing protein [Candidatus Abyssubacteria bacterium SURF_17]
MTEPSEDKYAKYEKYRPLVESIALFDGIEFKNCIKIMAMALQSKIMTGDVIFRKGDIGHEMYVILKGRVQIVDEDPRGDRTLAVLSPGETFGEMALFDRKERSAKAVAMESCVLLALDEEKIERLLTKSVAIRLLFNLVRMLSQRLRETNLLLARSKEH